jgi:hypothetical protein
MPEYTVKKIKEIQRGNDKNGKPFTKQKLRLETPDGTQDVLLYCPEWNPPPTEGSTIEGTIGEPFRAGQLPEFQRARKGGSNGFSGAGKSFHADPAKLEVERARNRSIAGQASQKVAVDIIRLALETKQDPAELARLTVDTARILLPQIEKLMEERGQ